MRYQVMFGNNMSTLGVSAAQLDNHSIPSLPRSFGRHKGEFGIGFGDFDPPEALHLASARHFTHSTETKQSQPNSENFENTQIRLSDGTVVFTPTSSVPVR